MVASRRDEEEYLDKAIEHVAKSAPGFLEAIASGNQEAVDTAKEIITKSLEVLRPKQIAGLLNLMLKNCFENHAKQRGK